MVHELRKQPLRSVYLGAQKVYTEIVRVPSWVLSNLPKSRRPRPSWSLRKCVQVPKLRLYSEFGPIAEKAGPVHRWPTHRAIVEGPGVKGVWLNPNPSIIHGAVKEWAAAASVEQTRIPGYWIDKPGSDTPAGEEPASDERVILYLHGGGYISASAHPDNLWATVPRTVLSACPSSSARRALAVEYRLCDIAPQYTNPFPAALLDAIAGYNYLINEVGFSPERIILLGDSAGGNLALALARYLVENATALSKDLNFGADGTPPDYDMILLSPWSDLGTSHETPGSASIDCTYEYLADLRTGVFAHARRAYSASLGFSATDTNAYLSPASGSVDAGFKGFPRTFIELGDAERFVDMCRTLHDRMVRDMGESRVGYHEAPDAIHDHLLFPFEEKQTKEAMQNLDRWLADRIVGITGTEDQSAQPS
ncbi:alpha/beta-hydrolase [Wolfiporia cocos MD-104 SS10]|uniref:Alpha/beta-hydrolase n=1 Tax=Wolfiporia cocos (strain MD-104) TaxID=742152 RepID=A0A2H3K668_WOLCO|nr:alpha/beta-hydrolase [Wolfiporia cocos MD-104 SS10]